MELLHAGRFAVIALGLLVTFPAPAGDWNFEASLGNAKVDGGEGTTVGGLAYDFSDTSRVWRVGVSRHLSGPFSVQFDYDNLGDLTFSAQGYFWTGPLPIDPSQCPGPICTIGLIRDTWRVRSYSLSGRADWNFESGFGVFGRLGLANYDHQRGGTQSHKPVLALGVSYRVNERFTLMGEFTRHGYQDPFSPERIVSTMLGVRIGL